MTSNDIEKQQALAKEIWLLLGYARGSLMQLLNGATWDGDLIGKSERFRYKF